LMCSPPSASLNPRDSLLAFPAHAPFFSMLSALGRPCSLFSSPVLCLFMVLCWIPHFPLPPELHHPVPPLGCRLKTFSYPCPTPPSLDVGRSPSLFFFVRFGVRGLMLRGCPTSYRPTLSFPLSIRRSFPSLAP